MGKVDDLYLENLNEFVFDEKKIVTYKYLAVTLSVHVNTAKQMLFTFYTREKQKGKKIYATYFLSGFAPARNFRDKDEPMEVDGDDDRGAGTHDEHFILLCGCHKLEEIKSKFTKLLSVHVYAVSASPVEDFQELKSPDANLTKNSSPHQKPMVYKAYLAEEDLNINAQQMSSSKRPRDSNASQKSPHKKSMVKTESVSPVDKRDSNKVSAPPPENDTNSQPRKNLFFNSTNKSDKHKNQKSSSKSSKTKTKGRQQKLSFKPDSTDKYVIKPQELSPKRKSQTDIVKKEEVFESDSTEEEEDIQEITPSPSPPPRVSKRQAAKSQPRHRKSRVYIESDSDNDGAADDVETASPPRRKSRIIESDSDDEDFVKVRSPLKQQQDQQQHEEQEESVHGKKRVAKMISKTFMAEDDYLVTKNVRELVSEDEDEVQSVKMEAEEVKDTTPATNTNGHDETKKKSNDVIPAKSTSETKKGRQPKSNSQSKSKQQSITSFFKPK